MMPSTALVSSPAPINDGTTLRMMVRALFHTMLWPAAAAVSLSVSVGGPDVTRLEFIRVTVVPGPVALLVR